jgi:hypothetical protein
VWVCEHEHWLRVVTLDSTLAATIKAQVTLAGGRLDEELLGDTRTLMRLQDHPLRLCGEGSSRLLARDH